MITTNSSTSKRLASFLLVFLQLPLGSVQSFTSQQIHKTKHLPNNEITTTRNDNNNYHWGIRNSISSVTPTTTKLHSLKPAAIPLMDAGKALARSGELLIDYTSSSEYNLYGGGLSAAGASLRNAGDCVAQAAASSRFKTAIELVCDELREASTCLFEACDDNLKKGVDDARVDECNVLAKKIEVLIPFMKVAAVNLEVAGERIMKQDSVDKIGECLVESSNGFNSLALAIERLGDDDDDTVKEKSESTESIKLCSQRMLFAAEKMKEAGNNLQGIQPEKKKGKSWLKG